MTAPLQWSAGIEDSCNSFIVSFRIFSDMRRIVFFVFFTHCHWHRRDYFLGSSFSKGASHIASLQNLYTILLGIFFLVQISSSSVLFTCCQHRYGMNTFIYIYIYIYIYTHTTHIHRYVQTIVVYPCTESFIFLSYIFSKSIMLSARDGAWGRFTHI